MRDDDIGNARSGYDRWSAVYDHDGNPLIALEMSSMHPAMMLRGTQAQFHDPDSGEGVRPGSLPHQVSDFVMAALAAGFELEYHGEHPADAELEARYPRAEKYIGWHMLVVFRISKNQGPARGSTRIPRG